jgi:CDP-glucose 4,6-dehydratase
VIYGDSNNGPHEAGCLTLETAKARVSLGITPKWTMTEMVNRTAEWYQVQQAGADARGLCEAEIAAYESSAD